MRSNGGGQMSFHKNSMGETFFYSGDFSNNFFEVNLCGITPANPDYFIFRMNNSVNVFEYILSGKGHIESGDKCYDVAAGDFYLLKSGFTGHYYADKEEPYRKIWVNTYGSLMDKQLEIYGIDDSVTIFHCPDDRIKNCLVSVISTMAKKTDKDELLELYRRCSVKLIELLSLINGIGLSQSNAEYISTAERIRHYLEMNIYNDISLADIAERFYMHEATLIRVFQRSFGVTPMKYLGMLRIRAAKDMLYNRYMCKDIAVVLGYRDEAYFSHCFKRETGLSPTEYAKSIWK